MAKDPAEVEFRFGLAGIFNRLGNIYEVQGDLNRALEMYEKALKISQSLVELDPTNAGFKRDLAVTFNNLGDIYEAQGDLTRALEMFEQPREISQ